MFSYVYNLKRFVFVFYHSKADETLSAVTTQDPQCSAGQGVGQLWPPG